MVDISCRNYSLGAGRSRYQAVNRSRKINSNDTFNTKVVGNAVYIEQKSVGNGIDWDEMKKIPGKYALKDGGFIAHCHGEGQCEYKFYYAAESTEEYPVLVARGVDEYGKYFEEKIDVKKINPYNTSQLELEALSFCKPGEHEMASNPYDCMEGQEKRLRERFNYVAGAQTLIRAWKRIGYSGQAAQWNEELNFLLGYTENAAGSEDVDNEYRVNAAVFQTLSEESKRNLELYSDAARERMAAGMIKRCSEETADIFWKK